MSIKTPMAHSVAWISMLPQILLIFVLMFIFYLIGFKEYITIGIVVYLCILFLLRNFLAMDHRKAIRLMKRRKFEEAIPFFEKSIRFFTENSWVDKFRYITLLSSSKIGYREMGLCNIAFCYGQIGNGQKAIECYEAILKEFPKNGLSISALNMFNAVK
jgi:tetratricopeptide (TPR) repeat protein